MRSGQPFSVFVAVVLAVAASTCGGSTSETTVIGPGDVRCGTTLAGQPTTVAADGGTVAVTVSAARDCTWTASSDAPWMQLSATSGQGNASLTVNVARNELSSVRTGAVVVNDQRLTIAQEARPCSFDLRGPTNRLSSSGGRGSIQVSTSGGCAWTATSSAPWVRILTEAGSGPGTVQFEVGANSGSARDAIITVGNSQHTITQAAAGDTTAGPPPPPLAPNCAPSVNPTSVNVPAAGGPASITLTINAACQWSALASDPWVTITSPATGQGNATITIAAAVNNGPARTATITIAEQVVTISQPAAPAPTCSYNVSPGRRDVGATSGGNSFNIATTAGCGWTASVDVPWVRLSRTSGSGSAEVAYTYEANTSTNARSATITSQGRTHVVRQEGAPAPPVCEYSISPGTRNVGATGGSNAFTITTGSECQWTASSDASWVSLSRTSGTGTAEVTYTYQANTAQAARTATITAQGRTHTIRQDAAPAPTPTCTFTVQPSSRQFPHGGGSGAFTITASAAECGWTASTDATWVTLSRTSGTGTSEVGYTVAGNSGTSARNASITAGGQAHAIAQEGAPQTPTCTFTVQPPSRGFPAAGGSGTFSIVTTQGCSWTASSGAVWVTLATTSGTGPAEVGYTVQANATPQGRSTGITAAGQTHTVTQEASAPTCTFSLEPPARTFGPAGGDGRFNVVTQPGCQWTASHSIGWVTGGTGSGTGSGEVVYNVTANAVTAPRSGTITVNGVAHTVNQEPAAPPPPPPCTFTLNPASRSFGAPGGEGQFTVETQSHCEWSASGTPAWVTIGSASGRGTGTVSYNVQANSATTSRTGSITVGGQSHVISQEAAAAPPPPPPCTFALNPTSRSFPAPGGEGQFTVETQSHCEWSASGGPPWVTIASSSGRGTGTVTYTVQANATTTSRTGSITVGGQSHAISQDAAPAPPPPTQVCTYSIAPPKLQFDEDGGEGLVRVSTGPGCAWSASTGASWIALRVTSGTGPGEVRYQVAEADDDDRKSTIVIAGQVHEVEQEGDDEELDESNA